MPSKKKGHVTRSLEQIEGTFCKQSDILNAEFLILACWHFVRIGVMVKSRLNPIKDHVGYKRTRSLGNIWEQSCKHSWRQCLLQYFETLSECLSWGYLGQVQICVMSDQT